MRRLLIAVPLVFLALTATAFGGGWATVGMSSTPEGAKPGQPWVVDMTDPAARARRRWRACTRR